MPRQPSSDRFQVGALVATPDERAGWVAVSQDSALPTRFEVRAKLDRPDATVALLVVVDPSGEVCVKTLSVSVPMPGPASLTTTAMRSVLIDRLLRMAIEQVSQPIEMLPEMMQGAFRVAGTPRHEVWVGPTPREQGRGRDTPRDRIRRSADLYRAAVARNSRSPVKDVATELGFSQSQASRYLKAARLDGMLDGVAEPTPGRREAETGQETKRRIVGYKTKDPQILRSSYAPGETAAYVSVDRVFEGDEDNVDIPSSGFSMAYGSREVLLSEENRAKGDEAIMKPSQRTSPDVEDEAGDDDGDRPDQDR